MKKSILITLIVMLLSLALVGTAFAQSKMVVIKGEVKDDGLAGATTIVVTTKAGDVTVTLPDGFDATTLKKGDMVMVKGTEQSVGSLKAITVRLLGGKGKGQGGGRPEDAGKANSAFCSEKKQGEYHPLAEKLAEKYQDAGIDAEWIMGHFCDGQSIGAIMLALKTAELNQDIDPDDLLTQRAGGESWGKIWQGLGMIGSEEDVKTPPGQFKKNNK